MADILYDFEGGLYFNITNECPCDCVFCVRNNKDEMGVDYTAGYEHILSETHKVLATDEEFAKWSRESN